MKQRQYSRRKAITYSKMLDEWLDSTRFRVKESTYARYEHLIQTHIKPRLGVYPLKQLSTEVLETYTQNLLAHGRADGCGGLSPKTTSDILTLVKSSLDFAHYKGYEVRCDIHRLTVKRQVKEMRVLNREEQMKLVSVLTDHMDLCKFGVLLSLYTGIRIGELCALKWEDISLSSATLKVQKTMQRIQNVGSEKYPKTRIIITEPKSKCSIREIPLPSFLLEYMRHFEISPQAYILTGDAERFIEPRTMQNHFKAYIAECGIAPANFHALRHTFATRCVEMGFELKSLSEILGHTNVNITLNRYVHSSLALKADYMNRLSLDL